MVSWKCSFQLKSCDTDHMSASLKSWPFALRATCLQLTHWEVIQWKMSIALRSSPRKQMRMIVWWCHGGLIFSHTFCELAKRILPSTHNLHSKYRVQLARRILIYVDNVVATWGRLHFAPRLESGRTKGKLAASDLEIFILAEIEDLCGSATPSY